MDPTPHKDILDMTRAREELQGHKLREEYGDVVLSIIAGPFVHCSPQTYLPSIMDYSHVEIGLLKNHHFVTPISLGIDGFYTYDDDVWGHVSWETVNRLRAALKLREETDVRMAAAKALKISLI